MKLNERLRLIAGVFVLAAALPERRFDHPASNRG